VTVWTTYGVGAATADEAYVVARPKYAPPMPLPVVMFCHGTGGGADYILTATESAQMVSQHVVNAGYTMLSCDLGGTSTWGNATAISRMTDAFNYAQTIPGIKTGPVILFVASMGGLSGLGWTATNQEKVRALFGVTPVLDLTDVHSNNRGGYTAKINAAHGGAYSEATHGATRNPTTLAAAGKYAGIPMLIYYGATDDICVPSRAAAFVAASGATGVEVTGGHDAVTYTNVSIPAVLAFLAANDGV